MILRILAAIFMVEAAASFAIANDKPLFAKGTWDLELDADYTQPIRFSDEEVFGGEISLGYYLLDNFSINVTAAGFGIEQLGDDAAGASLNLLFRWHFLQFDRFSIFIDGGGGRMTLDEASPPGGTTYNWIGRVGGGISWRLAEHWDILAGARYYHYSNGKEHGADRNPGYDGIQIFAGIMYSF